MGSVVTPAARTIVRRGALFRVRGEFNPESTTVVRALYGKTTEKIYRAVVEWCQRDREGLTDMATVTACVNLTRSTVLLHLAKLRDGGLIDERMVAGQIGRDGTRKRSAREYTLLLDGVPANMATGNDDSGPVIAPPPAVQAEDIFYDPSIHARIPWKAERLSLFNLLAALRISHTRQRMGQYNATVYIGPQRFNVEVSARRGSPASIMDVRTLIVVLTFVREYIRKASNGHHATRFRLNVADICAARGLDTRPSNKRQIYTELSRWLSTLFKLTHWITRDGTAEAVVLERNMSFVNSLDVISWAGAHGKTPEVVILELNSSVRKAITKDKGVLSVHDEILKERAPKALWLLLYFWCRRVVQHAAFGREFSIEHLNRELRPDMAKRFWRMRWLGFLQQMDPAGEGTFEIPGYIVRYNRGGDVTIHAQPGDPITQSRLLPTPSS